MFTCRPRRKRCSSDLTLHVKTTTEPQAVAEQLRAQLKAIDPHLPLYNIKTLGTEIDESLVQERLVTWLSAAFGVLATLLTALGLYGVLTFSVARRTREIGIRVALGAQRRDVFRLIMIRGVILVGVGVAVGLAASFAFSRLIGSLLFRSCAEQCDDAGWCFCGIDRGCFAGVLHPRAPRDEGRSDGCAAVRIDHHYHISLTFSFAIEDLRLKK